MDVEIGEITSTVRAVDGDAVLSPRTMATIVRAVLKAVRDERDHEQRVQAERKVTGGVSHEQSAENP